MLNQILIATIGSFSGGLLLVIVMAFINWLWKRFTGSSIWERMKEGYACDQYIEVQNNYQPVPTTMLKTGIDD